MGPKTSEPLLMMILRESSFSSRTQFGKYARECVSSEAIMCKRFVDGLHEEIRVLVGILELKEFVPNSFAKRKEKLILRLKILERDFRASHIKNHPRSTASTGISIRDRDLRYFSSKPQATSIASVGSVRNVGSECKHCNKKHYVECRLVKGACFKCGSLDHYLWVCPEKFTVERDQ
ncbi:Gag-Pol polyprotein [Gossypium australe]|uniref:Gag-Pol polyprotein n=1 Tax=Gossypium australe TaxID=47621 RepID=A0A5B6VB81_9ROSI|nr:Gag-Pol polyprotein [Gossypium australe]